jgi:membrane protease YdiL (CAAX protease family)
VKVYHQNENTEGTFTQQLSKARSIVYHLYPGIVITIAFILLTPFLIKSGYPPQLGVLLSVVLVAIPLFIAHLLRVKKKESKQSIWAVNGYTNRLPLKKLILYSLGLVVFMFLVWGITQPVDQIITKKFLNWLPSWYTVLDFKGYSKKAIEITLILNLALNGVIGPFFEEFYFRGYLLPRMAAWGKWAFVINTILFSLYHLWQPYVYFTLIIALMPMIYLVWRTKDIRLAILTHVLLNIIGALASFGLLANH